MTNTDLVKQTAAIDKLNSSAEKDSLDAMVASKTRRSLLLVDTSGSMCEPILAGGTKIEALRKVVRDLRKTHPVPVAAFFGQRQVELVETVPDPRGLTPMTEAINFGRRQGANHLVIVTDGDPDNRDTALDAARQFDGPIDTFYIGDGNDYGSQFAAELAKITGGTAHLTDLGKPKELSGKLVLALGNGKDIL